MPTDTKILLNANSIGLSCGWLISLTYTMATVVNPAVIPAIHRAMYRQVTDWAVAISSQARMKGKHEKMATFFRPYLSIRGPTASEPNGSAMVTRLAEGRGGVEGEQSGGCLFTQGFHCKSGIITTYPTGLLSTNGNGTVGIQDLR